MSTKYSADSSNLLEDGVAMTDHARHRYRQRTPHDCDIAPHIAWQRGEDIKHPHVAQSDGEDKPPERVRVYRHGQQWGIVFLVDRDLSSVGGRAQTVVVTVIDIQGFDHGPSRAYLHSHGPHDPGSQQRGDSHD